MHGSRPLVRQVQRHIEESQPDAGDQDRSHRHQGDDVIAHAEAGLNDGVLVLAVELLDAADGDRVGVPGVARKVVEVDDPAVVRGMEPVVHAGRQPQRHVAPVAVESFEHRIVEEIVQRVREPLGLNHDVAVDRPRGAHDGVAGAHQHVRVGIDRAHARLELANEAVVQAVERRLGRLVEIGIGEQAPEPDRKIAHQRLADLADPADELRRQAARNAIRQQEVELFLLAEAGQYGSSGHGTRRRR